MEPDETQKNCLVIAPIGTDGSEIRLRSNNVLKYIIKPVASNCGYKAIRSDEISESGIITNQIVQHILEDELVIADLTSCNPNVFYELALRHAVRKPYIQIAECLGTLPFDVAPARTIFFAENDKSSVDGCKQELSKQIKALERDPRVDSPISVGIDILQLRRSDNLAEKSSAEILSMLQDLRGEFAKSLREQSERISELQSLLTINAQNDFKDQTSSAVSIFKEMDWDNFIAQISLFDRTNLVELLDILMSQNTTYSPYSCMPYSYTPKTAISGFQISTEPNGDYIISFLNYTITVRKDDLKTFRDYVANRGTYSTITDDVYAGVAGASGYTNLV